MLIVRGPAILLTPADAAQLEAQLRHAAQQGELHPDLYPLYRNAKEPVPSRDAARNGWPFGQHKLAVRGCHQTA